MARKLKRGRSQDTGHRHGQIGFASDGQRNQSSESPPWAASAFTALFSERIHSASPTD
jgi:hypothetical protein